MLRHYIRLFLVLMGSFCLAGCQTNQYPVPGYVSSAGFASYSDISAKPARVETNYKKDAIELIIVPSKDLHSRLAVRHLRNRDWQTALGLFERAKKGDPKDHLSIFGMGVCLEKLGDDSLGISTAKQISDNYRAALEQYKAAILIYVDSKYEASRDRTELKIQTLTRDNPDNKGVNP